MFSKNTIRIFFLFETAFFAFWGLHYLRYRPLIVDDGQYLYCASLLWKGFTPYVDFFLPQGPGLLYLYGLPQAIFGGDLLLGRLTSVLLGLLLLLCLFLWVREWQGEVAGLLAVGLLGLNLENINGLCMIKPHTLNSLLLVLGAWFGLKAEKNERYLFAAAFMFGLAVPTRVPSGLAVAIFCLWVLKSHSIKQALLSWGVCLCGMLLPFLPTILNGGTAQLWRQVIAFPWNRGDNPAFSSGWLVKLEFILVEVNFQAPMIILVVMLIAGLVLLKNDRKTALPSEYSIFISLVAGGTILLYLIPDNALFSVYLLDVLPYIAALVAVGVEQILLMEKSRILLILVFAMVVIHPFTQMRTMFLNGFIERQRQTKPEAIEVFYQNSALVKKISPSEKPLLTFDMALAVQTGLGLLPGLSGEYHAYTPHWSTPECRFMSTVNDEMLATAIALKRPGAIVLSQRDLEMFSVHFVSGHALNAEEIVRLNNNRLPVISKAFIEQFYRRTPYVLQRMGQWQEDMRVWVVKEK